MAVLIPETGAGLPYANSYASLEFADAYFENHAYYADAWDELPTSRKTSMLVGATQQIDLLFDWQGQAANAGQALGWPRYGAYDRDGNPMPARALPTRLQQAVCEQAFYMSKGDPTATVNAAASGSDISRIKVDVLEIEFGSAASSSTSGGAKAVANPVLALLRGLGVYANGFRVRKVLVG
jgi:hypothetical protein